MHEKVFVQFSNENAVLPVQSTEHAAGYDLSDCLSSVITIKPMERVLVPTGVRIAMPHHLEAQVRPRSGLAVKYGITVLNSPGTIDADYRGEIRVALINLGQEDFSIQNGMRIAQMIFNKVSHPELITVDDLDETARGEGGFGHSGV